MLNYCNISDCCCFYIYIYLTDLMQDSIICLLEVYPIYFVIKEINKKIIFYFVSNYTLRDQT